MGQIQLVDCFGIVWELRIIFPFLKRSLKEKEDYVTDIICDPQSLKCLLSRPLMKVLADRC